MPITEELTIAQELLQKHFDWTNEELPENNFVSLEELQAALAKLLLKLLQEGKIERILQGMYRIDVSESKFKEVMLAYDNLEATAMALSQLVIERELQKVYWRMKYQQK
jgi:predicted transcriptional regulator of viral defense system